MYQILFTREDGYKFVQECDSVESKNHLLEILNNSGIKCSVIERDPKKWQLAKVVFDMQLIDEAKKSINGNKDLYGLYTFGDPDKIAKKNSVVKVKCVDGRIKNAFVIDVCFATRNEIADFKKRIGYAHLGIVTESI